MPPILALVLTVGFSIVMLRRYSYARDLDESGDTSWLPVIWIFLIASRFPSQWLALFGLPFFGGSLEEGSPLDAACFLLLIVMGALELKRRQLAYAEIFRENIWLTIFFVYCFTAILWSDFPFVAFKRWVKTLGHPVMALLILTSPQPMLALRVSLKRAAFIMIPLSVLFIKYFPEYGRGFDKWSGMAINRGISLSKNELGYLCLIFGLFFVWELILTRSIASKRARWRERLITLGMLTLIAWLLSLARSATSSATLFIGMTVMLGLAFRFITKRYFGTLIVVTALLAAAAEATLGLYEPILNLLGRNATLTDRTEVWADALSMMDSPVLGIGFESFWLGERLEVMWQKWWWHPNQAHNGYIETYLNLGAIGVLLLLALLIHTFRNVAARFESEFQMSRLRMAFFFAIIFYNFTEATFKATSFMWTMFYLISINVPRGREVESDIREDSVCPITHSNSATVSWN